MRYPIIKVGRKSNCTNNYNSWQPYLSKWQIQIQTLASDLSAFSLDPKPAYEQELI